MSASTTDPQALVAGWNELIESLRTLPARMLAKLPEEQRLNQARTALSTLEILTAQRPGALATVKLAELELSVRATNCLESEGITTVRELVIRNDDELLEIRNFGESTLREVKAKLALHGLSLGMRL